MGNEYECLYDDFGNVIWEKDPYGIERVWEYLYDMNGNMIWMMNNEGKEYNYEVEYYSDGQLKKYDSLELPWFEKK